MPRQEIANKLDMSLDEITAAEDADEADYGSDSPPEEENTAEDRVQNGAARSRSLRPLQLTCAAGAQNDPSGMGEDAADDGHRRGTARSGSLRTLPPTFVAGRSGAKRVVRTEGNRGAAALPVPRPLARADGAAQPPMRSPSTQAARARPDPHRNAAEAASPASRAMPPLRARAIGAPPAAGPARQPTPARVVRAIAPRPLRLPDLQGPLAAGWFSVEFTVIEATPYAKPEEQNKRGPRMYVYGAAGDSADNAVCVEIWPASQEAVDLFQVGQTVMISAPSTARQARLDLWKPDPEISWLSAHQDSRVPASRMRGHQVIPPCPARRSQTVLSPHRSAPGCVGRMLRP